MDEENSIALRSRVDLFLHQRISKPMEQISPRIVGVTAFKDILLVDYDNQSLNWQDSSVNQIHSKLPSKRY